MDEEMDSLVRNQTWDMVKLPIEKSLRINPRNVPLLDTGLMILVIICGIMKN